jgi:hypothetical protein
MFRNELSHGERALQGVIQRQEEFKAAVAAIPAAHAAAGNAIRAATKARKEDAAAQQKATAATQTYINALARGRGANETEAQFLQRIAGLRRAAAQADANAASTRANSNAAIRTTVDNISKLAEAGNKELDTARKRAEQSKAATMGMALVGKSESERTKILNESEVAQADLAVVEARRVSRLESLKTQTQSAMKAVRNSKMADDEKAATLAKLQGQLAGTNDELATLKGRAKTKVEVTAKTSQAKVELSTIRSLISNIPSFKSVVVDVKKGVGWGAATGGIAGFARGGTVRGPSGKDVIPAMLTAGEAVLTEKQQALVNSGMTVGQAFARTGVKGFAKGGPMSFNAWKKKNPKGTKKDYDKYLKEEREKRRERVVAAGTQMVDTIGQQLGGALSAKYSGGFTGPGGTGFTIGKIEELRRAQENNLKKLEASFSGTVKIFGQDWSGGFAAFDEMQRKTTRDWERNWKGTVTINGQVFSGGMQDLEKSYSDTLKNLDKKFEAQRKTIEDTFSALTPAEAALKALDEQAKATDLASNLKAAQKALSEAQMYGSAKQIADAEKALADARLAQQRAGLEAQAQAERSEADKKREDALAALSDLQESERSQVEAGYALARQQLQDQFDDARALRDAEYSRQREALQAQLDSQLQTQRDADAAAIAQLELQREQEQAKLDDRLAALRSHFEKVKGMSAAQTSAVIKKLREFDRNFRYSGEIMMDALVKGILGRAGKIKNAASAVAKILRDYLKLNSPAKKGPLSDINHWFDALAPTLMNGVDTAAIEQGLNSMAPGSAGSRRSGGSVTINLNVSDQTFAGMSREQADRVARDIQAAIDRQVRFTV